tara:strand:- start:1154 stop:1495 length:342 start_codon:yes stop_codon:yes gene_type:complete
MNLFFWSIIALMIFIAYEMLPKIIAQRLVNPNLNFYYGPAQLVREGMATLRKVTMTNYPFENATHMPTNFAINNTITSYNDSIDFNQKIASNIKNFPFPTFDAYNTCNLSSKL